MKLQLTALILMLSLTACGPVSFKACPIVVEYSKPTQNKAADELMTCKCPVVIEMMKDAKVMRDQGRACKK